MTEKQFLYHCARRLLLCLLECLQPASPLWLCLTFPTPIWSFPVLSQEAVPLCKRSSFPMDNRSVCLSASSSRISTPISTTALLSIRMCLLGKGDPPGRHGVKTGNPSCPVFFGAVLKNWRSFDIENSTIQIKGCSKQLFTFLVINSDKQSDNADPPWGCCE